MGGLAGLLVGLAAPIAVRVITALGMGLVTFTGVTAAFQGLIGYAQTNWSAMPSSVLALSSIAGIPEGLGIIAGAMVARVGMWVVASATRWVVG